jgi:hypothetical protein
LWCASPVPTPRITASVTDFPIITSDVTSNIPIAISAISETKSKIIGTYGNSGGNPSDGSTSTIKDDFIVQSETTSKASNIAPESEDEIENVKYMSKPRTALFQGREDDEPMAHRDSHKCKSSIISNIAANNSLKSSDIEFGAIIFYKKYSENMMEKFTVAGLSSKIYFGNTTLLKRKDDITLRKYVCSGSIFHEIIEAPPT